MSVLLLVFIFSESVLSTSRATEQLSIQTVLGQAPSYELHTVTLRGVIREMTVLPPIPQFDPNMCSLLYGHATFILEDDTGSLQVGVFGSCLPRAAASLPKEGDQVVLNAVIYISKGEGPVRVWAVANDIRLVQDATK